MANDAPEQRRTVRRLVGVYNADGSLIGELAYFVGARFGRAHCALCDITHGLVRSKQEWRARRDRLPVPFDTYHRDDQPDAVRHVCDGPPFVCAETDDGFELLIDSAELEECHGSVEELATRINRAVARAALRWPA